MLVFMISYRDSVMHDRGKLVRNVKVVDSVLWILLKPLSQTWMYISVIDSNKLIPNRPLVFVNQTNSVPNLMKIKPFLLYKKSLPVYHQMKKKNIELGIEAILVIRLNLVESHFCKSLWLPFCCLDYRERGTDLYPQLLMMLNSFKPKPWAILQA